ncbi:MAG: redoxin family protein, partial [Phycisphaerae bacterium]
MKPSTQIRLLMPAAVALCAAAGQSTIAAATPIDRVGETLADVALRDLAGKPVRLLDYHTDKVLVITYTGLGCPISGRFAPRLEALSAKYAKKGVRFVGINANPQDKLQAIASEMKELGVTFPICQDHEQALTKQLDAKTTTEVFVIDNAGKIRYRGMVNDQYAVGLSRKKPKKKYLDLAIRAVLAGRAPRVIRTAAPG